MSTLRVSYAERCSDSAVAHALRRMADRLDPPALPPVPPPTVPARPLPAGVEVAFEQGGITVACRLCGWRAGAYTMRADALRKGEGHRCAR